MIVEHAWPLAMILGLVAGIFSGYPVAFVLAGIGMISAFVAGVPTVFLSMGIARIYSGILNNWLLIAIPLFVFMGLLLERTGIAQRLLKSIANLFRGRAGGYAFAVAVIGIVMAATTGIVGASVVMLGMIAMPTMRAAGYDMRIASGLVAASGTLGILLPPSIMLIVLADQLAVSVGKLFVAAIGPAMLLSGAYLLYIAVIAIFSPHRMPADPMIDRRPTRAVLWELSRDLLAPIVLILAVLGSIITGTATPTESAAVGVLGAFLLALLSRTLTLRVLWDTALDTARTTAMILFVMMGATVFSMVFRRLGGDGMIVDMFSFTAGQPYLTVFSIMALVFMLGFFLDWIEITLVVIPIIAPVVMTLDLGIPREEMMVWFAIALAVNLQTSFLTPPFGHALFYLRGIIRTLPMGTIYRGIVPFVGLQLAVLALTIVFPSIVLWLPRMVGQ